MSARWALPPTVHVQYQEEIAKSRAARRAGDRETSWRHLERAHILGQMAVRPHVAVHLRMLWCAAVDADLREVAGQVVRTLRAGPGSYAGTVPIGDTGRARSLFPPPPIPSDLLDVLLGGGIDIPPEATGASGDAVTG